MIDRAAWERRRQQWLEYRRWAESEPPALHPPEEALADLGAILEWIPRQVRLEERDPQRLGVRRMDYLLSLLSRAG